VASRSSARCKRWEAEGDSGKNRWLCCCGCGTRLSEGFLCAALRKLLVAAELGIDLESRIVRAQGSIHSVNWLLTPFKDRELFFDLGFLIPLR